MTGLLLLFILLQMPAAIAKEQQAMPPMHHLFDVKPSKNISVPESFPLNKQQQVSCQTCHGIKDIKDQDFKKINKQGDDFFREGPYEQLSDFCSRCHDTKPYQRDNIHKMLDDKGKIIKSRCLYCHEKVLDAEKEFKAEELKLRLPVENICYGCHLYTPHLNALGHQKKPDKDMQKRIRQYEQQHDIILPLTANGRVTCISCHSSHPPDVISRDKPTGKQLTDNDMERGISYKKHPWNQVFSADKKERLKQLKQKVDKLYPLNYQRIEKEILLRLPAKNGRLCLACHEFEK